VRVAAARLLRELRLFFAGGCAGRRPYADHGCITPEAVGDRGRRRTKGCPVAQFGKSPSRAKRVIAISAPSSLEMKSEIPYRGASLGCASTAALQYLHNSYAGCQTEELRTYPNSARAP
jgi:hypothetical protein